MNMNNILIVEDDSIIAGDIEATLKRLGHGVSGVVGSGEDALRTAAVLRPDLVLMDIKLKGKMDGVETASVLRHRFKTPIVYLTAHADEKTLKRSKYTEPYGYIVKPFREDAVRTTIELASYKSVMDDALRRGIEDRKPARLRELRRALQRMLHIAQELKSGSRGDLETAARLDDMLEECVRALAITEPKWKDPGSAPAA
jgi:two-component system, response regulator PdtaR